MLSKFVPPGRESNIGGVAVENELIELAAELIPQAVEGRFVVAVSNVSELVQHDVDDFFNRKKFLFGEGMAEAKTDCLTIVPICTHEIPVGRPELAQNADFPAVLFHDGFHQISDPL